MFVNVFFSTSPKYRKFGTHNTRHNRSTLYKQFISLIRSSDDIYEEFLDTLKDHINKAIDLRERLQFLQLE